MIQLTDDIAFSYAKKIKDIKESTLFQNNPDFELITGLEETVTIRLHRQKLTSLQIRIIL